MKQSLLSILILCLVQNLLRAQEKHAYQTTFEFQTAIGYVDLLGGNAELLNSTVDGFYNVNISDYEQSGYQLQMGALATRQIYNSLFLRSGLQAFYLKSVASYRVDESYNDTNENYLNWNTFELEIPRLGLQLPLQLEYRHDFSKWEAYANLSLLLSYSFVKVITTEEYMEEFIFGFDYDPSCDCFPTGTPYSSYFPYAIRNVYSDKVDQFGAVGMVGFGAILKRANGRSWRIGYAFLADMVPFYRGNNRAKKIYEPWEQREPNHKHLIHQLEISMLWPERTVALDESGKSRHWDGLSAGGSISLQLPFKSKDYSGRTGVGWARNVQLKYISKTGFGARLQYGKWIAPASRYATQSRVTKVELLYKLPYGIEFSTGYARRIEYDVDGGGGKARTILFGTGGTIPLNPRMGLMLDLSVHYMPWENGNYEEQMLIEPGVGFAFRIF